MPTTRYIIEGNTVMREEVTLQQMVTLDAMLPELTSYVPVELSPMPSNCRLIKVKPLDNMGLNANIIVSHDPMMQRINHKNGSARSNRPATNYRINLPYGYFWFNLNGARMTTPQGENIIWTPARWGYMWGNQPFTSIATTMVWPAKLPNCWENGTVCFGSTNVQANQALGHFVDAAVNTFWTSEFNDDLSVQYPWPSMADWEAHNTEPFANWDLWRIPGQTMKETLNAIERNNWDDPVPTSTDSIIPPLRLTPTFYNIQQWLDDLSVNDRERLRMVING